MSGAYPGDKVENKADTHLSPMTDKENVCKVECMQKQC